MSKQVNLVTLGADLAEDKYGNMEECPITKALARAGYPELRDTGIGIADRKREKYAVYWTETGENTPENQKYQEMMEYVMMYDGKQAIPDKEFTLTLDL